MIEGDKEIQACVTPTASEIFGIELKNRWHSGIFNGHHIQGLEVVDNSEGLPVLPNFLFNIWTTLS